VRVVFLGTPTFAIPSLRLLARSFDVVGVVTQPDRPAGRGRHRRPSAVRHAAAGLGLPVCLPEKVRTPDTFATIHAWYPDVIVVVAYGQILPPALLELAPLGCLNLHASLLPRWRGAAPVQAALLHGDAETGVTVMRMDAGLDTGPILAQQAIPIREEHTGGTLAAELSQVGAELLVQVLPRYAAGELTPRAQDDSLATFAPRLQRRDGDLDPAHAAADLARRIRAFDPWPGARLQWGAEVIRVLAARALDAPPARPGTIVQADGYPAMATGNGLLVLLRLQRPGGRPLDGQAFLAGHPRFVGSVLRRPD